MIEKPGMPTTGRLLRRAALALALLPALMAPAAAQDDNERPCESLSLSFDSADYDLICYGGEIESWDAGRGPKGYSYEEVIADGASSWVTLAALEARRDTYLWVQTFREFVQTTNWFTDTRNWSDGFSVGDFKVSRFMGTWEGREGDPLHCASFMHYSGYAPRDRGYERLVAGTYCAEEAVSREALDRLLESVRF